jgi:hypothetical protein
MKITEWLGPALLLVSALGIAAAAVALAPACSPRGEKGFMIGGVWQQGGCQRVPVPYFVYRNDGSVTPP